MTDDVIISIDNGTQSVRALAFDRHGQLLAKSQIKLDGYKTPQPGWMEHDVDGFWQAVCEACRNLWVEGTVRPEQVRGLVVTTQRATVINLDHSGRPLRPAIIWPDKRRAGKVKVPLKWKLIFLAMGLSNTISAVASDAEANWIAQNEPEIWAKTHKFLLLSGYLNFRFTGRFVDAVPSQVGYIPFDYKKQNWSAANDWKWPIMTITPEMLPELAQAGSIIGEVSAAAASESGIPAGTPVIAGASDKACEVLGSGATTPDVGAISCGTTATINITTPKYIESQPSIPPYPAAIPGQFNVEVQVARGFWMVSWFAEEFGHFERQQAASEGGPAEKYFDQLIEETAPGADGLMLQPFWNSGVHEPGPEARGSIIGFTEAHKRAHVYRAVIEGLAYALRQGKETIEARSGEKMCSLRVAGGGSQSDAVMQIIADVINLPAERPPLYEASGLGAAILCSVGLGMHTSMEAAISAMTQKGEVFLPHTENVEKYDRLYRDVYSNLYQRLKPIYETLAEI